jgi:hypothetical protein
MMSGQGPTVRNVIHAFNERGFDTLNLNGEGTLDEDR